MTITNKRSLIALLLALVLVVSLFTVSVFAADEKTGEAVESSETVESSEAVDDTNEKDEDKPDNKPNDDNKDEAETDAKDSKTAVEARNTLIINGVIIVCILAVAIALIIRFHKKLGEFLRSVKSELKKIVWSSKENTRKSFIVVIVVSVVIALGIFLMDTAFKYGIWFLDRIIS